MPQDMQDAATAREFVSLGAETVAPVVQEMLRQLKDETSPVAQVYAQFFATHGEVFLQEVAQILLRPGMEYQKYMIVGQVLPHWTRESISVCEIPLVQLLSDSSGTFDTDLRSIQLLGKHKLAGRRWLLGWLDFKRENFARLGRLLEEVAADL